MTNSITRRWPALLVAALLIATGCQCGADGETDGDPTSSTTETSREAEDDGPQIEKAFGLPMPEDAHLVREQDRWIRVSTEDDLEQLEAFFAEHVVDAEIVTADDELQIVPLRPHSPRAAARHRTGPDSRVVIDYRQPPDRGVQHPPIARAPSPSEEDQDNTGDTQAVDGPPQRTGADTGGQPADPLPSLGGRPDWLNDVKGEPVELKTDDGKPLAPGARWGEPYTPPEGSPLHQERFRHNFGRPFGDWR